MTTIDGAVAFRQALDLLLELRDEPQRARNEFRWPDVGPHFNWARDWFDPLARGNEAVALHIVEADDSERSYSFDELRRASDRLANWLIGLGIGRGDVVMLILGNRVELWLAMLATLKIGAVMLPTSVVLGPHELSDRVERARVRAVIAAPADAAKFEQVPGDYVGIVVPSAGQPTAAPAGWHDFAEAEDASDAAPQVVTGTDDTAIIYFTSGTTSQPNMVAHSHRSYPVGHLTTTYWIGLQPGDVHLVIASPGWGKHAWSAFFAPWNVGATVLVLNETRFHPDRLVSWLDRAGVTTFCAPPTVWRLLIQHELRARPQALREIVSAGEPLNPEVIARIRQWWGLEIRDGYGQTETTCTIANPPGEPVTPGAMGRPLPGVPIVLIDPLTGLEADEGEVCLRVDAGWPSNLMLGYVNNPERTSRTIRDGRYHSGDVAVRGADGAYTFIGRTDDIFKSSDYKVSPFEVESALLEHEAVAEAAVVGAPDETRLNITKAYVVLARGAEASRETAFAILRHARETLAPYMRVRRLEFFELPKTASGKIRRVELRQREQEAAARGERLPLEWREEDFPTLKR